MVEGGAVAWLGVRLNPWASEPSFGIFWIPPGIQFF